ncbi:hypothetical protein FSP39_004515 [Pinctada imbricata]|uniref:Uncharacterized protein n=1 Tax=Pinctada imbricata TaxID=66713 RepID=A0AA88XEL3_PINIB|nr:hypothetical protein FSP39_004515 [Pinctada imbricata]
MPDFIKENDFPSIMNDSAAKNLIVHVCNIIMITILRQPESELAMANNETKTYLEQSKTILQVNNTLVDKFKLYFNDPSINLLNGSLSAATWSNVNMPKVKKYDYDYYGPVSPVQIQTKMVSKATVKRLLPNETFNDISMTCRDLNKLAYYHAVSRVPLHIMARFHERRKRIYFYEDSVTNFDLDWMLAQLQTQNFTNGLHITSTRLETDRINDSNSHMNISGIACNLLSPFRVLEWIYLDSIKS